MHLISNYSTRRPITEPRDYRLPSRLSLIGQDGLSLSVGIHRFLRSGNRDYFDWTTVREDGYCIGIASRGCFRPRGPSSCSSEQLCEFVEFAPCRRESPFGGATSPLPLVAARLAGLGSRARDGATSICKCVLGSGGGVGDTLVLLFCFTQCPETRSWKISSEPTTNNTANYMRLM